MSKNSITLFSNGIGHFSRSYNIDNSTNISIPFKKEHIGDVAASLQVFGKVKLSSPPSFTPSNSDSTHLNIDQSNAMRSLLKSLSGATVNIETTGSDYTNSVLLGIETDYISSSNNGTTAQRDIVVVMSGSKLNRIRFDDIQNFEFVDDAVRQEIDKALKKNFQQIKPDSTFLDLTIEPRDPEQKEAVVQYTIPVAAWKMRYAIREENGSFHLEGAAVIDNNTDEDWMDSMISVVTGNPISFDTDIATVVIPKRRTINLVESNVLGNVEVSEAECFSPLEQRGKSIRTASLRESIGSKMSISNYADFGMEAHGGVENPSYIDVAESAGVDTKEVGDFSIFTSKQPVTILARKSAVVPMFQIPLSSAGAVLYYKEKNHSRRPYRAVKFKNEADYTLNRGKATIYNDGIFSGECVLETTKPNENRTLPHCLENGVKIVKELKGSDSTISTIRISRGVIFQELIKVARTNYLVVNKKNEEFNIHLEHNNVINGPNNNVSFEGVEVKETEKVHDSDSYRVYFKLAAGDKVTLSVIETMSETTKWNINGRYGWIESNIIGEGLSIANDETIQECASLQKKIDDIQQEIIECDNTEENLSEQASRVRQNLAAAKDVSGVEMITEWVKDLDVTDKEIRRIEREVIPSLKKDKRDLEEKLTQKLKSLSVSWKNSESPKVPA